MGRSEMIEVVRLLTMMVEGGSVFVGALRPDDVEEQSELWGLLWVLRKHSLTMVEMLDVVLDGR